MIKFENVSFAYTTTNAEGRTIHENGISGLDLSVCEGEFVVLTGGSGCGKTTVTRLIN